MSQGPNRGPQRGASGSWQTVKAPQQAPSAATKHQPLWEVTDITQFAQVLRPRPPKESVKDAPILTPPTRASVRQWIVESDAGAELESVGLQPRRTCVLVGPPGCGKTTLARHFAERKGLPLVMAEMPALIGMYMGEASKNLLNFFRACAERANDMVLFLDEIDAIATRRGDSRQAAGRDANATVIALLQLIESYPGLLFAASNRGDDLDAAVWRRFSMQITVDIPDFDTRFPIVKRYLAPLTLPDESIDLLCNALEEATPDLIRRFCEGLRRDYALAGKLDLDMTLGPTFRRIMATVRPHEDLPVPPLWASPDYQIEKLDGLIDWPPTLGESEEAA